MLRDPECMKNHVNLLSFEMDKIFHGTPSGIDNSAICFGGIVTL